MFKHTMYSGETVGYEADKKLRAFIDKVKRLSESERSTVANLVDLIYSDENPLLEPGPIPGRGLVTRATLENPAYQVMQDLLYRRQLALASEPKMTVTEAAAELGMARQSVLQAIKEDRLEATKVGNRYEIHPAKVREYQRGDRGPKSDVGGAVEMRVGTVGAFVLQVRAKGGVWTQTERSPHQQGFRVVGWNRLIVKMAAKRSRSMEVLRVVPYSAEQSIELGPLYLRGRFLVDGHYSGREAEEVWKAAAADDSRGGQ